MSNKERLLKNLHKIFRKDLYLNNILEAAGNKLDDIEIKAENLEKEIFFDTMSDTGIVMMEKELDYITNSDTLEEKRKEIEVRWKTTGKCTLELLKKIANNWRNGEVEVIFKDAEIHMKFISIIGIPNNLESFKKAIDEAIPAHLGIKYLISYRVWRSLENYTWEEIANYTWREIRDKEGILTMEV